MSLLDSTSQLNPAGSQVTQRIAANQALLASGQTLTPQVAQQASIDFGAVNQQMQNTQTPGSRQQYLDTTNLGAAQNNYDALAKQLASYDSSVLQPQFAGTDPGQPTDMPYNPLGYTPQISYLTPSSPTGVYNANPTYGMSAQADQGNSIVNLLGTLSKTIANEAARGTNKYTSDLKSLASMLGPLNDILTQNTNLTIKKADLAAAKAGKGQDNYNNVVNLGDKLVDDLSTGKVDWGDAWQQVKSFADRNGVSMTPQEIDTLLHGRFDATDLTGAKGLTTRWARQGAAQEYASGLRFKQTGNSANDDADFKAISSGLDSYTQSRSGTNLVDRINPTNPSGIKIETQKNILSRLLAKLVEKNRISDQDAKFYLNELPAVWMNDTQSQAKIDGIKAGLAGKLGLDLTTVDNNTNVGWQ